MDITKKIYEEFDKENFVSNENRNRNYHISQLSMCGLKYRYELDHNVRYPFNWKYLVGNSFEFQYMSKLKKIYPDVELQKEIKYTDGDGNRFVGHLDGYIPSLDMVLELKATNGSEMKDIYERQVKAYMYIGKFKNGKVIIYNYIKNVITEYDIDITDVDLDILSANITAFTTGSYMRGIENYLCRFCQNSECVIKQEMGLHDR